MLTFTAALVVALLSLVYQLTLEPIEINNRKAQTAAKNEILSEADDFIEIPTDGSGSITKIFEGVKDGRVLGYIIEITTRESYNDSIDLMVGISSDRQEVTGVRIIKHSETPGLGAVIANHNFYDKFDNIKLVPLTVVKTAPGENEIDAIAGATISTRAVTNSVNQAIEWYLSRGNDE